MSWLDGAAWLMLMRCGFRVKISARRAALIRPSATFSRFTGEGVRAPRFLPELSDISFHKRNPLKNHAPRNLSKVLLLQIFGANKPTFAAPGNTARPLPFHRATSAFSCIARLAGVPLLYKGDDFIHTDIAAAIRH